MSAQNHPKIAEYIEYQDGRDTSDSRVRTLSSALHKLSEFASKNDKSVADVNIDKFERFLSEEYADATARSYRNDALSFLKYVNNSDHLDGNYIKGDSSVSEDSVVEVMEDWINDIYSENSVKTEYTIAGARSEGYRSVIPDIVVHDSNVAVECKGNVPHTIGTGVAQCIFYSFYGFKPIIATPVYWDDLISICESNDIGLVYVDVESNCVNGLAEPSWSNNNDI